ncbi:hypothetical protein [Nitrincola sp. MINF-07-Sa-05]|uniref:COG4648 family protein n=1 Tax=Nitrincola salilacus TaxID=3400273 RepID=UPI003917FD54
MKIRAALPRLLQLLVLVYPLYVWLAIGRWGPVAAIVPLALIALVKSFYSDAGAKGARWFFALTVGLILILLSAGQAEQALLFYPVWINLGMLMLFAWSLWFPPTVIERIARAMEGAVGNELDEQGVAYTRKVTQVWCLFFIMNGAVAMSTALYGDWDLWVLYNGLIAYCLMGLLMLIEWRVRKIVKSGR